MFLTTLKPTTIGIELEKKQSEPATSVSGNLKMFWVLI